MSIVDAVLWIGAIASVGVLIDACELLNQRLAYSATGLFDYAVLRSGRRFLIAGPLASPLGVVFGYPAVLLLPVLQIAAACFLLTEVLPGVPFLRSGFAIAAGVILVCRALLYLRNQLGHDGSDQMFLVVFLGLTISGIAPDQLGEAIGIYYIAAQSCLSYFTSGFAKVAGPKWRKGTAVPEILNTVSYGYPPLGRWLANRPTTGKVMSWGTMFVECLAPLLLLFGIPGALVMVVLIVGLHASIAIAMGLNIFFWSFVACAPALVFAAQQLHVVL